MVKTHKVGSFFENFELIFSKNSTFWLQMHPSETQARIISHAFLQADASAAQIAKECKASEKTVRATLSRFEELGIIRPFSIVNIHALGYTDFCVALALSSDDAKARRSVLHFLQNSSRVAWIAELSGEFHFSVSIFAKDVFEVQSFFSELASHTPSLSLEKYYTIRLSWTSYRCKYFGNLPSAIEKITRTKSKELHELDHTDRKILLELSNTPTASRLELSRRINIPVNTLNYRIKSFQLNEILCGTVYYLEAHKVGLHAFRLLVYAKNADDQLTRKLEAFAASHPHISAFIHCLGHWDYELNIEVPNPPQASAITQELYDQFGKSLRMVKIVTLLQTVKTRPYPFVLTP